MIDRGERVAALFSGQYGFFKRLLVRPSVMESSRCSFASVVGKFPGHSGDRVISCGVSADRNQAIWSAVGEAVERFFAYDFGQLPVLKGTSYAQLAARGEGALNPSQLNYFTDEQYASAGFEMPRLDESSSLDWVEGRSLREGRATWVPAYLAFFGYGYGQQTGCSSGLACGTDFMTAAQAATLELIERDAFMFHWWTRTPVRRLRVEDLIARAPGRMAPLRMALRELLERVDLGWAVMDHGLPVVVARVFGAKLAGAPGVLFSAAASVDPIEAAIKALYEMLSCCDGVLRRMPLPRPVREFDPDFDVSIKDFKDSVDFYLNDAHMRYADFLFEGSETEIPGAFFAAGDTLERGERLAEALTKIDIDPVLVDLSPPNVKACGLRVVRAIAPELLIINARHRYRGWGQERLFVLKQKLGLCDRRLNTSDLNTMPHPFP